MSDEVDFYGHRLAAVNVKNNVLASEDIYNKEGVLLLSKGSNFTDSRAELIAKHKLIKPLEHSVDIEKSLDAQDLFDLLIKFSSTLPGLKAAVDRDKSHEVLLSNCTYYAQFSLLRQKLTVLASQLPEIYYHSLYSAVAGTILAIELNLDEQQHKVIFISGLMHNTGFLHLDPGLTKNEAKLERDDSLRVQAHPVIAKHFLDHVDGLPKTIGLTVADHHERTDGTGYPKHKFGLDLTIESQVLAFTDTIVTSYNSCIEYEEHAHQLMHVILQLNNSVHFETVYKAAVNLIKLGPSPTTPPKSPPSAKELVIQQERITETFDAAKKLAFVLMNNTRNRMTKSIASMLGRIATSIISAGITQIEYHDWLDQLSKKHNVEEDLDLLKSKVMLDEIEVQIERFKSIIWKTIKKIPEEDDILLQNVMSSYHQMEKLKTKEYN